jgi:hypothetical protein
MTDPLPVTARPPSLLSRLVALAPVLAIVAIALVVLAWRVSSQLNPVHLLLTVFTGLSAVWATEYTRRGSASRSLQVLIGLTTTGSIVVFLAWLVSFVIAVELLPG